MKIKFSQYQAIILIIVLISLIYFQSNFYQLIFLDDDTIVYNQSEKLTFNEEFISIFTTNFLSGHYYRPLTSLSFYVNAIFSWNSPILYHITNFLLHLLSSILIYLVLKKLGYTKVVSFISTLVFAVNPIHINAVGWVAGRGDLLAAFLTLIAFYIYIKFINGNRIGLLLHVSIFIFLSFLSKEVALLTPFLFLIFYVIEKKELLLNKNSAGVLLMILIPLGLYYILRITISSNVHIDKFSFTTYYKNILVLPETVSKFLIPFSIKALPSLDINTSISGIIILILLLFVPIILKPLNKYRYYFGLIWFIVLLIPGMVFRTMEQDGFYYWDCRSYLPLIGLAFFIAEIMKSINFQKYKILYVVLAVYFFALSTVTFTKIRLYENALSYWNAVKTDYPQRFLPYIGLYNYYDHIKATYNAEDQLIDAIKLKPNEFSIRQLLINFYLRNKQDEKAFNLLKDSIYKRIPGSINLLEKYIFLSYELKKFNTIEDLTILFKDHTKVLEQIYKIKLKFNL